MAVLIGMDDSASKWIGRCRCYFRGRLDLAGPGSYISRMSRVSVPAAKLATFSDWLAEAKSILRAQYNVRPTALRPKEWTQLYVRGLPPEEAAQRAAVEAWNALTPNERRMRRV